MPLLGGRNHAQIDAGSLAVGLSIPAAAATTFTYSLAGTGTATPGGCFDCTGPAMDATGTAEWGRAPDFRSVARFAAIGVVNRRWREQ